MLRSRVCQTTLALAAVLLPVALLPGALQADVIYTNFGDGDSFLAGSGLIVTRDGAAWSSVAISFVPAASYSLSSIEFGASALMPGSAGASLAVFADDDGHPDSTPLETIALDGLLSSFGDPSPLLKVKSSVHPLLEAGQTYWIGMNAAAGGLAVWNQTTALTTGFSATDGEGNWSTRSDVQGAVQLKGELVFETPLPVPDPIPHSPPDDPSPPVFVTAAQPEEIPLVIPEPGDFCLTGFGLAALLLVRRQKFAGFPNQK
ncbi:MAG TPA: hypothetical protein VGM43_25060 [Bryobacteraceae bacterium]|jgi:hypothetical protein